MEFLANLRAAGFGRGIGPGIYDIHSPRVPSAEEMTGALLRVLGRSGPASSGSTRTAA